MFLAFSILVLTAYDQPFFSLFVSPCTAENLNRFVWIMSERNPSDQQDPLHSRSILGPSQSPEESADILELRAHVHALQHNPLCYRILENALHCLKEPCMDIIQGSCDTCVTAGLCMCVCADLQPINLVTCTFPQTGQSPLPFVFIYI